MTAQLGPAMAKLLKWEGRYSNHPADAGGETYCGIARRRNPYWDGWAQIDHAKDMKMELGSDKFFEVMQAAVVAFYVSYYWNPCRCGELQSQPLADFVFSCAVNFGVKQAVKLLQRAVGTKDDGVMGPVTVSKCNELSETALPYLCGLVDKFYRDLAENKPSNKVFLKGWLNRLAAYRPDSVGKIA